MMRFSQGVTVLQATGSTIRGYLHMYLSYKLCESEMTFSRATVVYSKQLDINCDYTSLNRRGPSISFLVLQERQHGGPWFP